jgi:3-deoxy-D-manno-octulosonate 8-phosphate phosphatase (KDO 8-P phosphatase)
MKDAAFAARCQRLRLVLTDVDGVLTDGTVLLLPGGGEAKAFNIRDGLGIALAHEAGLRTGIVSGRTSDTVTQRANELGMHLVRQGIRDKGAAFRAILQEEGLSPQEVAFMGDDVNDLPILTEVGLSGAPADAAFEVRAQAFMVTDAKGGHGCLREFLEAILKARGAWEHALRSVGVGS